MIKRCCSAPPRKSAVAFGARTSERSTLELWGCELWPAAGAQAWTPLVCGFKAWLAYLQLRFLQPADFQARPTAPSDPSVVVAGWGGVGAGGRGVRILVIRTNEASVCDSCATLSIRQRTSIGRWHQSVNEYKNKMASQVSRRGSFPRADFRPTHKTDHAEQRQPLRFPVKSGKTVWVLMDSK